MSTYSVKLVAIDPPLIEHSFNVEAKNFKKAYKKVKSVIRKKEIQYEIHKIHRVDKKELIK